MELWFRPFMFRLKKSGQPIRSQWCKCSAKIMQSGKLRLVTRLATSNHCASLKIVNIILVLETVLPDSTLATFYKYLAFV